MVDFEISPFVQNMATGKSIPLAAEEKSEYGDHLDKKYKWAHDYF